MSVIEDLQLSRFRNIDQAELRCHPHFNLIHGGNGSGKTSILEAVHLLALGRSFRTANGDALISDGADEVVVFARLSGSHKVGVSRARRDGPRLKLDDKLQKNWDIVAQLLPVLLLDAGAFQLLEGGPGTRRQFTDWGVFHVEPGFLAQWRRMRKCLANRNQLLKQARPDFEQIAGWDRELCEAADRVDQARQHYLDKLLPEFQEVYRDLAGSSPFELALTYERGWDHNRSLEEVLHISRDADLRYKATQFGPQRADVVIKAGRQRAVEVLSRGQQKLLVSALKIAQGRLLPTSGRDSCTYLIDDLGAELDGHNRETVLEYLCSLGSQLFVTCVDGSEFQKGLPEASNMALFHVERGRIRD